MSEAIKVRAVNTIHVSKTRRLREIGYHRHFRVDDMTEGIHVDVLVPKGITSDIMSMETVESSGV